MIASLCNVPRLPNGITWVRYRSAAQHRIVLRVERCDAPSSIALSCNDFVHRRRKALKHANGSEIMCCSQVWTELRIAQRHPDDTVVLAYLICAPLCVDDAAARHAPQRMRAHAVYICMCAVICFGSMRSIKISSCMHACTHIC